MFVWFLEDSVIAGGSESSLKFVEYRKNESERRNNQHGQTISALDAKYLFHFNPFSYAEVYGEFNGSTLPNRTTPMFIPKSSSYEDDEEHFICVLQLHCPRGMALHNFVLAACYTDETPLLGLNLDNRRRLKWFLNLSMLISTNIIVLAHQHIFIQRVAIYAFLLAAVILSALAVKSFYSEHKKKYGGSWLHAFDLVAHYKTLALTVSWCLTSVKERCRRGQSHSANKVRPTMDSAVAEEPTIKERLFVSIEEREQFDIYRNVVEARSNDSEVVADEIIAAAVKRWRRMEIHQRRTAEAAEMLSEACRGHVAPAICAALADDVTKEGDVIERHHEMTIIEQLTATYLRVRWRIEQNEFYRDVLYGPVDENGIKSFKWHLGL